MAPDYVDNPGVSTASFFHWLIDAPSPAMMKAMSHLHAFPAAITTATTALGRDRFMPPSCPEVDAPHTAAALAEASAGWEHSAETYAAESTECWSDATRFLDAVTSTDDTLARGWA